MDSGLGPSIINSYMVMSTLSGKYQLIKNGQIQERKYR